MSAPARKDRTQPSGRIISHAMLASRGKSKGFEICLPLFFWADRLTFRVSMFSSAKWDDAIEFRRLA